MIIPLDTFFELYKFFFYFFENLLTGLPVKSRLGCFPGEELCLKERRQEFRNTGKEGCAVNDLSFFFLYFTPVYFYLGGVVCLCMGEK